MLEDPLLDPCKWLRPDLVPPFLKCDLGSQSIVLALLLSLPPLISSSGGPGCRSFAGVIRVLPIWILFGLWLEVLLPS